MERKCWIGFVLLNLIKQNAENTGFYEHLGFVPDNVKNIFLLDYVCEMVPSIVSCACSSEPFK